MSNILVHIYLWINPLKLSAVQYPANNSFRISILTFMKPIVLLSLLSEIPRKIDPGSILIPFDPIWIAAPISIMIITASLFRIRLRTVSVTYLAFVLLSSLMNIILLPKLISQFAPEFLTITHQGPYISVDKSKIPVIQSVQYFDPPVIKNQTVPGKK